MEEPRGHACPECGAPRETDGSPSCPCGQRAADALRDTRTAEAAAAEDFDPLRIRPYVDIDTDGGGAAPGAERDDEGRWAAGGERPGGPTTTDGADAGPPAGEVRPGDGTAAGAAGAGGRAPGGRSRAGERRPAVGGGASAPAAATPPVAAGDATMPLRAASTGPATPLPASPPTPLAAPAAEPSASDLSLFGPADAGSPDSGRRPQDTTRPTDPTGPPGTAGRTAPTRPPDHIRTPGTPGPAATGEEPRRTRRTRRTVLLAAAGAAVAVVAGAGLASGLLSYEKPVRDGAAPREVRVRVPDVPQATNAPSGPTTVAPPPRPAPTRPRPSADASPSPSPSASATDASPSPSRSGAGSGAGTAAPTQTAATVRATATVEPAPVLRRGDQGPEVTELQLRLAQLGLYTGPADGRFGRQVEDSVRTYQRARGIRTDETGVYGPATRASLEAETSEP